MIKNRLAVVGLILSLVVFSSCNGDPEMSSISLEIKATSANNTFDPYGRVEVSGLTFTAVLIGVTEIELESEIEDENEVDGEESNEEEIEFEGQFILDLINGTSDPDLGLADINPGDFNELELDLAPLIESMYSVKIKGKFTPQGGVETEFIYTNDQSFELEIEKEGSNFNIPEGGMSNLLVLLNLDQVFEGISFDNAVMDQDGKVYIRRGNDNEAIAIQLEQAFAASFDCGEDNDDDDEIDD